MTEEFTAHSHLLDTLMADESFFDRLITAFPDYARFVRVLNRQDTASRVTLADVANMTAAPVGDVVIIACGRALEAQPRHGQRKLAVGRPGRPELDGGNFCRFDARPLLEAGHEPLPVLLAFAEEAPAGTVLIIDTTFHPQPLRGLFEGRGYESAAEPVGDNHWRTYFRKAPVQ